MVTLSRAVANIIAGHDQRRDPRKLPSSRRGGCLQGNQHFKSSTQRHNFFRGVDYSTQEGIPFWSQGTRFSLLTGKCLSNRVTCEWSETRKLKWEWIDDIENLHIQSLPDSKAMSYGSLRWEGYVCTDPLMITSWSIGCYSSVVRERVRNLQMSYLSLRIYNYYII